jgi:hypothetical protein
LQPLHFI